MEQHPVPQPISSYEFRLIGSMTLKQFAKLAGCAIAGLIIYATPLPGFLKWPLVGLFALLGLGMAFLPINERPLDTWIVAFFKAVFSPTQYLWQKKSPVVSSQPSVASPQTPVASSQPAVGSPQSSAINPRPSVISDQSSVISYQPTDLGKNLETKEQEFLKTLQKTYTAGPIKPAKIEVEPPKPKAPSVAAKFTEVTKEGFLFTPTQPNIIYGIIKNAEGKMVEGVIMEIRDNQENVVRALRTNKLGQFRIATSLPNGTYELVPEKEGLVFDIINIDLKGEILPPIEIISKPLRH